MSDNQASSEPKPITCGICGGACVEIRPRMVKGDRRLVCPTCLADRMDLIRQTADPDYGVAFAALHTEDAEGGGDDQGLR